MLLVRLESLILILIEFLYLVDLVFPLVSLKDFLHYSQLLVENILLLSQHIKRVHVLGLDLLYPRRDDLNLFFSRGLLLHRIYGLVEFLDLSVDVLLLYLQVKVPLVNLGVQVQTLQLLGRFLGQFQ